MLRYVSGFYIVLSVLSIVGAFILMADSITPLFFFISGVSIALIWISLAMVTQELSKMQLHIELQTKFMRKMTKKSNGR